MITRPNLPNLIDIHFRDSPDSLSRLGIPGNYWFHRFAVTCINRDISLYVMKPKPRFITRMMRQVLSLSINLTKETIAFTCLIFSSLFLRTHKILTFLFHFLHSTYDLTAFKICLKLHVIKDYRVHLPYFLFAIATYNVPTYNVPTYNMVHAWKWIHFCFLSNSFF